MKGCKTCTLNISWFRLIYLLFLQRTQLFALWLYFHSYLFSFFYTIINSVPFAVKDANPVYEIFKWSSEKAIACLETNVAIFLKKILCIYFKGEEKGGDEHHCVRETLTTWLLHILCWGPGLEPRHAPWLGIKPVTFRFVGWCSIHWDTPARAVAVYCMWRRQWTWLWELASANKLSEYNSRNWTWTIVV